MLEFACPKCSETVRAADGQAGEPIICPKCSQTIRVPGETAGSPTQHQDDASEWSVFDDDEKFIEESMAKPSEAGYRTREDDREPIVDNDAEAARQEVEEEKQAVADALARSKSPEFAFGPAVTSDMTVEEKMAAEARYQSQTGQASTDPRAGQQGWNRTPTETADPIRLDDQPSSENSLRAKCQVCDSVTLVGTNKAGTTVVCSDCGSPVQVPAMSDADKTAGDNAGGNAGGGKQKSQASGQAAPTDPEDQERKQKSKITEELFLMPTEEEDDQDYGLAPADEDLLRPVAPTFDDPDAADSDQESSKRDPHLDPTNADREDRSALETSELFEEMQAEKIVRFELLPWKEHIFGILKDPGFLLRVVMSALVMLIGYSILYFGASMAASDPSNRALGFFGALISIFAFPFIPISFLTVCWLGQKVLNSTIVGEKKMPDMEGSTIIEWVSNCMFVGVGLGIGVIPGALLGALIGTLTTELQGYWAIAGLGTMTAMLISPLIILSAMHNRSPFKISSSKISGSIKTKSDAWIEFYLPGLVTALVTGGLWFLAMVESWFLSLLMLIAINVGFGLYFRMMGRLMGTIVSRTKKQKTENPAEAESAGEAESGEPQPES